MESRPIKIPKNYFMFIINKILVLLKEALLAVMVFIVENVPNSYEKFKRIILFLYKIFGKKEFFMVFFFCYLMLF